MGRARLVEGQACRYGHAWNRSADRKRCLTCYPLAPSRPPRPALPVTAPRLVVALSPQERRDRKKNADRARRLKARQLAQLIGTRRERGFRTTLRQRLHERQGGLCALTGLPLAGVAVHVDHIVPVTRGGTDDEANLQLVVRPANMAKGNGTCEEFHQWLLAAADALRQKIKLETLL